MPSKRSARLFFVILFAAIFIFFPSSAFAQKNPRLGTWVTVFSPGKILYSRENADHMIEICKKSGIDHVYIQIYRENKAYYDSDITDRSNFDIISESFGQDPVKYLISECGKNDIDIYAWVNLLSVAQNTDTDIQKKIGPAAVTLDRHERTSYDPGNKDTFDDYYIRENQLFLEPGNKKVRKYLVSVIEEILKKYPGFNGIHLDYVRYPVIVPFVPGSRFDSHGISYGYTYRNMLNFKKHSGLDVKKMEKTRENFRKWDDWRRSRVTALVKEISGTVKAISPDTELSCAVISSVDLAYISYFQDWTRWLREGLIDYVVTMNYTEDLPFFELRSRSSLMEGLKDKIYVGVGSYLFNNDTEITKKEIRDLGPLSPGGIVIFSYDDIEGDIELQEFLSENFRKP